MNVDESVDRLLAMLEREGVPSVEPPLSIMDAPNCYFFSLSTVGMSKAVMSTQTNAYEQTHALFSAPGFTSFSERNWPPDMSFPPEVTPLKPGELAMLTLSFFHMDGDGMGGLSFDIGVLLRIIDREKLCRGMAVSPMLLSLVCSPNLHKRPTHSVNRFLTGDAPLGPDLHNEAKIVFGCPFRQVWGASEATGAVMHAAPFGLDKGGQLFPGSSGKPVVGVGFHIVNAGGDTRERTNLPPG
ncbi:hypothetical protein K437DRAFT_270371 [Tilletiaria anomala UBC 951]|uniref:AMP-dependent synthetase/ligase domain-containing protein n=1 Tax=Tilletiaria anomala (strain ATCC 24038 / CBS 436.72 / UBC 951) TaxID=1037660 RepID=A0A066VKP6_TILAU|nr:uncharacterized protein K437DRAFT_270371 [Tilletiaria anomala UBC 951]KDN39160.1 hypothetical protein K437DRAFT_270371 [Tilletiaria anomala UBC 951]